MKNLYIQPITKKEENKRMNQLFQEMREQLTGRRGIYFDANIIKEEEHDIQLFVLCKRGLGKDNSIKD